MSAIFMVTVPYLWKFCKTRLASKNHILGLE